MKDNKKELKAHVVLNYEKPFYGVFKKGKTSLKPKTFLFQCRKCGSLRMINLHLGF